MEWLLYVTASLFVIIGAVCVLSILLTLPGSWIMIGLACAIELADGLYLPEGDRATFGLWILLGCAVLAAIGEGLELLAGMLGARKAGSSRRGMFGALVGGILGAILGIFIPVPIIGSLIGAVIGTFVGAIVAETSHDGASVSGSIKPATGATIGRILGTLSKLPIGIAIWIVLSITAVWH